MQYEISKELFEAVIGNKVGDNFYTSYNNIHHTNELDTCMLCTNINDFFFKCKNYIKDNGFQLQMFNLEDDNIILKIGKFGYGFELNTLEGKDEKQLMFNQCQWILENKDK